MWRPGVCSVPPANSKSTDIAPSSPAAGYGLRRRKVQSHARPGPIKNAHHHIQKPFLSCARRASLLRELDSYRIYANAALSNPCAVAETRAGCGIYVSIVLNGKNWKREGFSSPRVWRKLRWRKAEAKIVERSPSERVVFQPPASKFHAHAGSSLIILSFPYAEGWMSVLSN